jgi:hypothetical protein
MGKKMKGKEREKEEHIENKQYEIGEKSIFRIPSLT